MPNKLGNRISNPRVAVIHEWLVEYAGSEKVTEQILRLFPDADLFSVIDFFPENLRHLLGNKRAKTTCIQKLPFARTRYRNYLPLMPLAIEQLDVSSYDIVISSSHAVAKGVLCGPDQLHISYVHSPMRYAWDMQHQYLKEAGLERGIKSWLIRWFLHKLRLWDTRTANGVDVFIANSNFIADRIAKSYRREATVIYPPVDTAQFTPIENLHVRGDYYLAASRLVPYKKMELIVEAFSLMPKRKLVVIGDGPCMPLIKKYAASNIQILGYQPFPVLKKHMQSARAFVFAAEEDFGIIPLEAQACGLPVIAYGKGGALETVRSVECDEPTGIFFYTQSTEAIINAVDNFEDSIEKFNASACRKNALEFSEEHFCLEFKELVMNSWRAFNRCKDFSDAPNYRI